MPKIYIDSTSLADAYVALARGHNDKDIWATWIGQCLFDCTYHLCFWDAQIVPGSTCMVRAVPGNEEDLSNAIPGVVGKPGRRDPKTELNEWLKGPDKPLVHAWNGLLKEDHLSTWRTVRRDGVWQAHIQAPHNNGLFRADHIPEIAKILPVSEIELHAVHRSSQKMSAVKEWIKGKGDRLSLVDDACLISSLIRGKEHLIRAQFNRRQLAAHPHRNYLADIQGEETPLGITDTANFVVRLIMGSAFRETQRNRVKAWHSNLQMVRRYVHEKPNEFLHYDDPSKAEKEAIDIAEKVGIEISPIWQRRASTFAFNLGIPSLAAFAPAPDVLGAVITAGIAYKVGSETLKLFREKQ